MGFGAMAHQSPQDRYDIVRFLIAQGAELTGTNGENETLFHILFSRPKHNMAFGKVFGKTGRRGRRPLRHSIGKRCVGVGLLDDPPRACTDSHVIRRGGRLCPPADSVPHSRQGTRALPYKNGCRAGPMCPAALPHPL